MAPPSNSTAPPPPESSSPPPPPTSSSSPPPDNSSSSLPPKSLPPPESPPPPSQKNISPPPPPPPPPPANSAPPPQSSDGGDSPSPPPPPHKSPPPPFDDDGGGSNGGDDNGGGVSPSSSSNVHPPPSQSSKHSPPPPHSGQLAPPKSHKGDSDGTSTPSHQSDVNIPLVIGVTAGVAVFLILLLLSCVFCGKKKKTRHHHDAMNYYTDPSRSGSRAHKGNNVYYDSGGPQVWGGPPSMDHVVKLPPPPGGAPWMAPPPPPPPMQHSSDMSSVYSGPHGPPLPPPSPNIALGFNKSTFTYDELAAATNAFSENNLLGQGGFGYVHKGVLPNGKEIAVKSLKSGSGQGEREFQAEVEIISRVHHRHLVSLVGYCIAGGQRMLVYEFVPNGTLEYHLYGKGLPTMDFPTRLKIALGSAKGLAYLHEDCHPKIIHRDIKAANILLDYNFEAMVADFGLAKLSNDNHTHVSTRVMGTFGYLAPEYASSGKLTEKSDVFSFGVMLLELLTGRRPVDTTGTMMEDSLVDWARPLMQRALNEGIFEELVDPRLEDNFNPSEMTRLIACASASVRHSARRRPKMSQIVRALEGDSSLEDLNDGGRTGQSSMFGSNSSNDYDSGSYKSQMRKFQRVAMASEEFESGEYGGGGGIVDHYGGHRRTASGSDGSANSRELKPPPGRRAY